ncbi:MAG: EAL domain-containing protein [Pseudomonadota bacterium]
MANSRGHKRSYLSDVFVLIAMALVSSALGVFLVMQLGYDQAIAGFAAAACFAALSSGHILMRRNDSVARLQRQLHQQPGAEATSQSFDGQIDALRAAHEDQVDLGQYRPSDDKVMQAALQGEQEGLARLQPKAAEATLSNRGFKEPVLNDREQIGRVIQRLADDLSQGRGPEEAAPSEASGPQPPALPAQAPAFEQALPAQPTAGDKLAAIADALSNERVEVFLEPIHGLEDGAARHYEVTIRLAMMDGQVLDQAAYSEATRGSAILPLIDAVKVSHTKRVGLQLLRRGKSGALISQINGESVRETEFSDDLSTIMGVDQIMAGRLILAFSQQDVRNFAPGQWEAIERLRAIGFRFAIGDIVDLDIDFEYLAQRGFTFARLDATIFRQGLRLGEALVPPADICRHLALAGLTLIVDRLTTDRDVAEVFGFGALFGQGTLFGGPRPVKAHVLREDPRDIAAQPPQSVVQ